LADSGVMTGFEIPCRAVLFDFDGVLVDSKDSGTRAWTRWASEHGLDPSAVLDGVHGRRSMETVALFLPEPDRAAGVAAIDGLEIDDARATKPLAGAAELLSALPQNWAVITSATKPLLQARVGAAGLELPQVVVTSEDVNAGKPAPDGYQLAAEKLGVPIADCVVVEDSLNGIRAGRAALAGYLLGIGYDALESDADSVVLDLRACTWSETGLLISPEYLLRT
jgi:mannitol-1-/sugar-/sorbitol-6-phosphatase